jgi:hypothetical protein
MLAKNWFIRAQYTFFPVIYAVFGHHKLATFFQAKPLQLVICAKKLRETARNERKEE